MKINRLFEIVYMLLEKETVTAKELSEHFGVSIRTIYRDIDILSTANIPIYTNKGKRGGICLLENFVLDKSIISEEEQNQIIFALQSLEKLTPINEKNALEKMSMLFNKPTNNWIEIDFSNWETGDSQKNNFSKIKEAVINKKVIEFTYYSSYGEESKRQVEPLQIWFKDRSWYIKAYCKLKEDYRIFKISRIKDIQILDEHFDRNLPIEKEEKCDFKIITLKLEISKEMAYRIYDEFDKENITKTEDGNFIVEVEFPENEWVYGYILSFGEYVKVLSPEYAREIIKDRLEKSIKNYL